MTVGGAVEYPLLDGLGSLRHLTDGSGNVTLSRSYDAFGNLRYNSGTGVTRLGYTGELQDQLTGLVYLRARFYHPVLGRFLQRDSFAGSIGRGQSLNRYAYTENNPANLTDPSGNCPWCIAAGIGAGAGAAFEYGGQVYQNYRNGQSGSDMFRPRDWGKIGQAAVAGGVGGLTGFYLGPAAAGLMRFGSPMMNSIAAGALEGAGSGVLSQIATNLMRGCAWNADLTRSLLMGGLGGGIGGALGRQATRLQENAKSRVFELFHGTSQSRQAFANGIDSLRGGGQLGPGFYTTPNRDAAEWFARNWAGGGGRDAPKLLKFAIPQEEFDRLKIHELSAEEFKALSDVWGNAIPENLRYLIDDYDVLVSELDRIWVQIKFNPRAQNFLNQLTFTFEDLR